MYAQAASELSSVPFSSLSYKGKEKAQEENAELNETTTFQAYKDAEAVIWLQYSAWIVNLLHSPTEEHADRKERIRCS